MSVSDAILIGSLEIPRRADGDLDDNADHQPGVATMSPSEDASLSSVTPKDVFRRSNMPSRWERLVGVAPKTPADRTYLAFAAARYRGDERLPHPDVLKVPRAVTARHVTHVLGWIVVSTAVILALTGLQGGAVALAVTGAAVAVCALAAMTFALAYAGPAVREYEARLRLCRQAQDRLQANPLDRVDLDSLNAMIACDEGTLTYCAAKIVSEIEQDPAWRPDEVGFVTIDLLDELSDIAASARQIAKDREATEDMKRSRLRDDPEVRAAIAEDQHQRVTAIALLADRVHALADYRDQIQRTGLITRRDRNALNRATREAVDKFAKDRLK